MKNSPINILIADDDPYCRLGVKNTLSQLGVFTEVGSAADAIEHLSNNFYDLAIVDMQMEYEDSGIRVLQSKAAKNTPIIILSSHDDDALTELSYNLGCLHFLNKLHYKGHLEHYISNFINKYKNNNFQEIIQAHYITQDNETIEKLKMLFDMNLKDKCIFLTGETGVGKSQIGKIIHHISHNQNAPFIHLNCSEISEELIESELFGHTKGSFTGATSDKQGKLELANNGILFLDEIATMSLRMQQKILKALDEKIFYPVGSNKAVRSNFTLISATCEDLLDKITKGEFRKDLFFRISGVNIEIKPLRKRPKDINLLLKFFMQNLPRKIIIKEEVIAHLLRYPWPGNIRELKKVVDYLSSLKVGIIKLENLPPQLTRKQNSHNSLLSPGQLEFIRSYGFRKLIEQLEQDAVTEIMQKNQGKVTKAVKEMRISNSAFYRILEQSKVGM